LKWISLKDEEVLPTVIIMSGDKNHIVMKVDSSNIVMTGDRNYVVSKVYTNNNEKCFRQKLWRKSKVTFCVQ